MARTLAGPELQLFPNDITPERWSPQKWLDQHAIGVALTMTVRVALRSLPKRESTHGPVDFSTAMLSTFRALAVSWASARYPGHRRNLRPFARRALPGLAMIVTGEKKVFHLAHAAAYVAAHEKDRALAAAKFAVENNRVNREDAIFIDDAASSRASGHKAVELASRPLWPKFISAYIRAEWRRLQNELRETSEDWDIWIDWYEDRLAGRPSLGETFDIAVATLPDELWRQGPASVNARIKELISEHTTPVDQIPIQGAGPHFFLNSDAKLALAPPDEFDLHANNVTRIRQLLPVVRQATGDLAGHLNPNAHPELTRVVAEYRAAITGEPEIIAWGIVFGLGVRLENFASAAHREIAGRLQEPLEDAEEEALASVLALHGPLVLSTKEGRELMEAADQYHQTREDYDVLRANVEKVAKDLAAAQEIAEPAAAKLADDAAGVIGRGRHPERGMVYGITTLKHAASIFIPAAALASFVPIGAAAASFMGAAVAGGIAWAGYESFKRSNIYQNATAALGPVWDQLFDEGQAQAVRQLIRLAPFRNFVTSNEEPLRRIAENSSQMRWTLRYIDFITRTNR